MKKFKLYSTIASVAGTVGATAIILSSCSKYSDDLEGIKYKGEALTPQISLSASTPITISASDFTATYKGKDVACESIKGESDNEEVAKVIPANDGSKSISIEAVASTGTANIKLTIYDSNNHRGEVSTRVTIEDDTP